MALLSNGVMAPVDDAYLALVKKVLERGKPRNDRTGTGTLSLFGEHIELPLVPFPLLSAKKTWFRGVFEELVWMLRGQTNTKVLEEKGVFFWSANGTREALDKAGLTTNEPGDLGPIYGAQWRGRNGGIDQIKRIVDAIRTDPTSRRMILSAWNPVDLDKMALSPCHVLAQFYVTDDGALDVHVYQRSCDVGLGLPFNLASYGLLTNLLCHVTGKKVGRMVYSLGDVHIYKDHVDALTTWVKNVERIPFPPPKLSILCNPKPDPGDYGFDDVRMENYSPGETVRLNMSV